MDFLLATVLCFVFFGGFNAQPEGQYNFVCRDFEEYDMCRPPCEATCDTIRTFNPNNCSKPCVPGCFCKDGYIRGRDNVCVPPEECFRAPCPENEEYHQCGSACDLNCTNLHEGIFCTKPCRKGCFCKSSFVRNDKGKCVDPRTCGVVGDHQCPANEQYVNCVNRCNTCWDDPYCRPGRCLYGCDCKLGYFRNSYGECVTEEQCIYGGQQQCGANEVYTNCVNTCNYCVLRGRCDYDQYYCKPGCDCEPGFLRNERGACVLEQDCFSPACHENEVYLQCGPACRSTCENYKRLQNHHCKEECVSGCFCRGNFVIGPTGKCVSPENCQVRTHSCPQGESFYQCLPTCRKTCRSLSNFNEVCSVECKPGCFCQPGLVRNKDGKCVRPTECPVSTSHRCPPGKVFYDCVPCQKSCENLNPVCTMDCRPGCACEKGLVRRRDGRCIRLSECHTVCGPNKEFRSCGSACPLTCEDLEKSRGGCSTRCVRGCFCKSGLVVGPNGKCIRPQSCPNLTPIYPDIEGRQAGSGRNVTTSTPVPATTIQQGNTTEKSNSTDPATTNIVTTSAPNVTNTTTPNETNPTTPNVTNPTPRAMDTTFHPTVQTTSESSSVPPTVSPEAATQTSRMGSVLTTTTAETVPSENATTSNPTVGV